MKRKRLSLSRWTRVFGIVAVIVACALPAAAQSVTSSDIQRLQDQVYQASGEISRLRSTNPDSASRLQTDLDDLRDEVVYLKVKMRREGSINQNEYTDVRDRLQELRSQAGSGGQADKQGWRTNSDRPSAANGGVAGDVRNSQDTPRQTGSDDRARPEQGTGTRGTSAIPVGKEIDVQLERELSSSNAQVEQRFTATTVADLYRGDEVLIPAGSVVRGVVSGVTDATRTQRKGSLTLAFDQITVRGRDYPMRGTVTQAIESKGIKGEAGRIGAGAGVGAIIGGILGGAKGALLGVLIGGGGTVAATEGKDVTLPAGTVLRVALDTPPAIR
jgi:TolA-binding protein